MKPAPDEVCAWLVVDQLGHAAPMLDRGRAQDYAAAHHAQLWPLVVPAWAFESPGLQQAQQQPAQDPP